MYVHIFGLSLFHITKGAHVIFSVHSYFFPVEFFPTCFWISHPLTIMLGASTDV